MGVGMRHQITGRPPESIPLRDRLSSSPAGATPGSAEVSYSEFTRPSSVTAFRASVAYSNATRVLAGSGLEPVHVLVARVSGDMCRTLGVYPASAVPVALAFVSVAAVGLAVLRVVRADPAATLRRS